MSVKEKSNNTGNVNWLTENLKPDELVKLKTLALISYKIECKRNELGMNQRQFSKYMKVSCRKIKKWESGSYNFTIASLIYISRKLKLNLEITLE